MDAVIAHPKLQGLPRFVPGHHTAGGLNEKLGFTPLSQPDSFMERYVPDAYERKP